MPKNIVLLSDGTGNSSAKLFKTNVWRTYESLDLTTGAQLAFYDDGVGTSSFSALARAAGVIGWGLKRNVVDLYCYLCEHYRPGDRLYAFGFSRGAFTIRVLVGLVAHQGILRDVEGSDIRRLAAWAYRRYRRTYKPTGWLVSPLRWVRDRFFAMRDRLMKKTPYDRVARHRLKDGEFTFVGLWDTVDAYALPIDEFRDGVDKWVWPLSIPSAEPSRIIGKGCHALALDDERQTFRPVLWDEANEKKNDAAGSGNERITQVWFAGVHSNVGGGYADDRLSMLSLDWMLGQAKQHELAFIDERLKYWSTQADTQGRLYDSRAGFGGYYRYCPRKAMVAPEELAQPAPTIERHKIHESVFRRIRTTGGYAPIILPNRYSVVQDDGTTVDSAEGETEPTGATLERRLKEQENV